MKKHIVCVGCSWTYGHGLENHDTYPALLQDRLSNYKVINAGHCGSDINYAIFSAVRLISEFKPEILIFQITTFDRITLGTDGFENFVENAFFLKSDDIYYEDNKDYIRLMGIGDNVKTKITHGSFMANDQSAREELGHSKIRNKLKAYRNFVQILFENVIYSDYQYNQTCMSLFLFEKYLESMKVKGLFFKYPYDHEIKNKTSRYNLGDNCIKQSFREWLDQNYPNKNFFIDKGYHLSRKGNEILVDKYLMPHLEKLL